MTGRSGAGVIRASGKEKKQENHLGKERMEKKEN